MADMDIGFHYPVSCYTTRTDLVVDSGIVDIGFHYFRDECFGATGATACVPCDTESKFTLISSSYGPIY